MPDREHSLTSEIALDRYWDGILAGTSAAPEEDFDPGLAATAQRVHALDAAPSPHPVFASTLWEDLMSAQTMSPAFGAKPSFPFRVRSMHVPGRWLAPAVPQSMSRIAAAILIIMLLAGSAFAALYPLRLWDNERLPLFAPAATPTAEPALMDESVLLDLTLSDIPPYLAEGGMAVTNYPPGGSSREWSSNSTEVLYIAAGPMTARVDEALQPVRVIPAATVGSEPSGSVLAAGEELTLETGTTLVAPPETIIDLVNSGSGPTMMLDLLWSTPSYSTEAGGAVWRRARGGKSQELAPPVSVVLRQVSLDTGEAFAAPDADEISQAAASVDPDRNLDVMLNPELDIVNAGDSPLDVYVLTVDNAAGAETSAALTARQEAVGVLEFLWESEGGPDPLSHPYGLAIDPDGNLWVVDGDHDRFQVLAPDGAYLETWGTPGAEEGEFEFYAPASGFGVPYGDVAFDADGNIYVADTGNQRVQKFAPDRSFLLAWGSEGKGDGQFVTPSGIAVGPDGAVYVSDEQRGDVQMFDADGRFLGTLGEPDTEEGQFLLPGGVGIDGAGDVWVAEWGGHRIKRFSASGEFLSSWGTFGSRDGELHNPNDVAVDELGRVYVADDLNYRLQVFAPDGRFLAEIGGPGPGPVTFNSALGVAVDEAGIIYVSDNSRVQAFRLVLPQGDALSS